MDESAVESYNEFRAVYGVVPSYLDAEEDHQRGFVIHKTGWFRSPHEAQARALAKREETHAHIIDMEMSWVARSAPESIGK